MRERNPGLRALPYVALAALCYLPLVLTAPGAVVPDTKPYLTIDPGRLLRRALSLWDPGIGLGTVTHQTIGYLWPMGPYHWLLDQAGVPDWLAQRLWFGSVLFAAATGVLFLLRSFGVRTLHGLAGALPYVLTPYVLGYAGVTAILLPYAGLPWMVGLVVRGLRRGGWRHPALFALVVTSVGSINATALLCAVVGALCWVPLAVWSRREVPLPRAIATVARMGALTVVTQLWWLVALVIDGAYGASILEVTETIETTAAASLASEVVRGLGYWFFYGGDRLGPWVRSAPQFQTEPWLIAVGFVLPVAAVLVASVLRWSVRSFAVVLLVVGTAISVGAYPYASPPPLGGALKRFAEESAFGLALRNSQRAVPLVVLGFALLLAGATAALARRSPRAAVAATMVVGILAAAANPALFDGTLVDPETKRHGDVPGYWREAARFLDQEDDGSRVLELPGADFAAYRWGTTTDPVTPGLMDRPSVSKELVPSGGDESVDLISALDRRLQEGVFEVAAVAPVARLMGAGDVLLRSDLQYERYRTPRPRTTWSQFTTASSGTGLGAPVTFGDPAPNRAVRRLPLEDEIDLAVPADVDDPPPVAVFPVREPVPVVRIKPAAGAVTVAGDAEGLVDLAAAGVLEGDELVRFSRDLPRWDLQGGAAAGAVVVTDSNRRRARRWSTVRDNFGFTEPRGFVPLPTSGARGGNQPIPTAGDGTSDDVGAGTDDARTVVEYRGIEGVAATDYGNIISYTPEHRAFSAIDGDVATAWRVGAFSNPEGARWRVDLEAPVTVDRLTLVQPQTPTDNRYLTAVSVRFDDGRWERFALDKRSRLVEGQALVFTSRSFRRVEVRLDETNIGRRPVYDGLSSVGIAELRIGDVVADEVVRVPHDLLDRPEQTAGRPLWFSFTRARSDPAVVVRSDEEPTLARAFALPAPRSFGFEATVRLSAAVPDDRLDELLGTAGGARARSSGRLPGDLRARASSAIDGDPTTAWSPGFLEQRGNWIEVALPQPTTVDRLDLQLLADGLHSTPTRLAITNEAGERREVDVAPVEPGGRGHVVRRPVTFPALTATTLQVMVVDVHEDLTRDYFSTQLIAAPVGIAELGIPGVRRSSDGSEVPDDCRDDLLSFDGRPFGLRLVGSRADAEARRGLRAVPCDVGTTDLSAGEHELRSSAGARTGIEVDRIVLASSADGGAADPTGPASAAAAAMPASAVEAPSRSAYRIEVVGSGAPVWLVLGQSRNRGWEAKVDGRRLPGPVLVDGFANGWLLDLEVGEVASIDLSWRPQRVVRAALAASAAGALVCCALVGLSFRRRHDPGPADVSDDQPVLGAPDGVVPSSRAATALRLVVLGALALLVVPPLHAMLVLAAGGIVLALAPAVRRSGRIVLVVAAGGALAAAGLYTTLLQVRYGYPPGFHWPREFGVAHRLAWIGILLLAVEAVLGPRSGVPNHPTDLSGSGRRGGLERNSDFGRPDRNRTVMRG